MVLTASGVRSCGAEAWAHGVGAWSYGVTAGAAVVGWVCGTLRAGVMLLPRTVATLAQAEIVITNAERAVLGTVAMVDTLQLLLIRAGTMLDEARGLLDEAGRLTALASAYEKPLADLAPTVGRIAETMTPAEVDAIRDLLDQLRVRLADDLLPVLHQLRAMGPDAHGLLGSLESLGRGVRGLRAPAQQDPRTQDPRTTGGSGPEDT